MSYVYTALEVIGALQVLLYLRWLCKGYIDACVKKSMADVFSEALTDDAKT